MAQEIVPGVLLFRDDDDAFIRWCEDNPDGHVCNCEVKGGMEGMWPYMLHSASWRGKLCPHFRNSNLASGFAANLTTKQYCKVVSLDRGTIEEWAKTRNDALSYCSTCVSLP